MLHHPISHIHRIPRPFQGNFPSAALPSHRHVFGLINDIHSFGYVFPPIIFNGLICNLRGKNVVNKRGVIIHCGPLAIVPDILGDDSGFKRLWVKPCAIENILDVFLSYATVAGTHREQDELYDDFRF